MIEPEDVQVMLEDASAQVAEPDFADRVWADARVINRRQRRLAVAAGLGLAHQYDGDLPDRARL